MELQNDALDKFIHLSRWNAHKFWNDTFSIKAYYHKKIIIYYENCLKYYSFWHDL